MCLISQVALVEGELTEVVETSCGKSVIAVGTTIFELSGVDFGSREVGVVDMSSGDCTISSAPSSADCYRFGLLGCLLCTYHKTLILQVCSALPYIVGLSRLASCTTQGFSVGG